MEASAEDDEVDAGVNMSVDGGRDINQNNLISSRVGLEGTARKLYTVTVVVPATLTMNSGVAQTGQQSSLYCKTERRKIEIVSVWSYLYYLM